MIYTEKPKGFNSKFDVVGCFVEHEGKLLLLHRQDHKPQGNTWGLPSGKTYEGEDTLPAVQREVSEETGLTAPLEHFHAIGNVYVKYPTYDFMYYMFVLLLTGKELPQIKINSEEHKAYQWLVPYEITQVNGMEDLDTCVAYYLSQK